MTQTHDPQDCIFEYKTLGKALQVLQTDIEELGNIELEDGRDTLEDEREEESEEATSETEDNGEERGDEFADCDEDRDQDLSLDGSYEFQNCSEGGEDQDRELSNTTGEESRYPAKSCQRLAKVQKENSRTVRKTPFRAC